MIGFVKFAIRKMCTHPRELRFRDSEMMIKYGPAMLFTFNEAEDV